MKYKYIPTPELQERQEARPKYSLENGVFIIGWEVGHYEEVVDKDLPKDVEPHKEWVHDYDVMELTPEEEAEWEIQMEMAELKAKLAEIDYKAIKYAEGWYTYSEYADMKREREALRERIRELENAIA